MIAIYGVSSRRAAYPTLLWPALEYLTLFAIVLTHEFGHALACRSVGGKADQIVLWPLGGVAYVSPPQRPGAVLWSIAAGPLVNVILAPILIVLWVMASSAGWDESLPSFYMYIKTVCEINLALLIFNILPIYPLDGGQIVQSLLWFLFGRARSLMIATIIGFIGVAALAVFALISQNLWLIVLCVFIVLNCWQGLMYARILVKVAKMPHRPGFACPDCHQQPIVGPFWRCDRCSKPFDPFETHATCPNCGMQFGVTRCPECGKVSPYPEWVAQGATHRPPQI